MRQRPRSPEPWRILPATHQGFADGETVPFGQPGDLFWSRSGLGASVAVGNTAGWLASLLGAMTRQQQRDGPARLGSLALKDALDTTPVLIVGSEGTRDGTGHKSPVNKGLMGAAAHNSRDRYRGPSTTGSGTAGIGALDLSTVSSRPRESLRKTSGSVAAVGAGTLTSLRASSCRRSSSSSRATSA